MDGLFHIFLATVIHSGSMEVETASGHRFVVGDGAGKRVAIRFADRAAQISLMLDPELHFGELFMDGRIEVTQGSVYDVLMLAADNLMQPKGWVRLLQEARLLVRRFSQVNDKVRAEEQCCASLRSRRRHLHAVPRFRPAIFLRLFRI